MHLFRIIFSASFQLAYPSDFIAHRFFSTAGVRSRSLPRFPRFFLDKCLNLFVAYPCYRVNNSQDLRPEHHLIHSNPNPRHVRRGFRYCYGSRLESSKHSPQESVLLGG